MKITYWTDFSKKKNSTKQPTSGTEIDVYLKDETSIINPTFDCANVAMNANYIYCQDFGRYYFVTDVIAASKDRIYLVCAVDPMASAKTNIGSYNAFVERSAAAHNAWASDGELVPTIEIVQNSYTPTTLSNINATSDIYVMRVTGKDGAKNYVVNSAFIQSSFNTWYDINNLTFGTVIDNLESMFWAQTMPGQFVNSIKWFPFNISATSGASTVYFGFRPGNTAKEAIAVMPSSATIQKPSNYYNDWRDYDSRFTLCSLYLPGYGTVQLDPKYLEKTLTVNYESDVDSGMGTIYVKADYAVVFSAEINIACDVPFGGVGGGGASVPSGMASILGSISLTPMKTLSNALGGLKSTVDGYINPPSSTTGSSGNRAAWLALSQVLCQVVRLGSTGKANAVMGQPLREYRQLSTLSGFNICQMASIDCPFTSSEKDTINGYLNNGFYYE